MMKVLFLQGWYSTVYRRQVAFMEKAGFEVSTPALNHDDFKASVALAQETFRRVKPDVIVGASRGGAVAMNFPSGETPLVLVCPGWKRWGTATQVKGNSIIVHSPRDGVIVLEHSLELVQNSGLNEEALIRVGKDHRMADDEPMTAVVDACKRLVQSAKNRASHVA